MQHRKISNSLTVELTAYIELNLNGTWSLIGFEPDTIKELTEPKSKQSKFEWGPPDLAGEVYVKPDKMTVNDHLANAQRVRKQRKSGYTFADYGTIRKVQRCTVCGIGGVNSRTCLLRETGERKHRPAIDFARSK